MTALIVAAVVMAGGMALLLVPIHLLVAIDTAVVPPQVEWRARWLGLAWHGGAGRASSPRARSGRRPRPARPASRPAGGWRRAFVTPGLARPVAGLVARLLRVLAPRELDASLRIGFDDPGVTGMMMGPLMGLTAAAAPLRRLHIEPDFANAVVSVRAHAAWAVAPGALVWPLMMFLATPVVWRAAWRWSQARRPA